MVATVGLVAPGAMGAAIGAAAVASGHRVLWASQGRGPATRERAERAGLVDAGTLASVVADAEILLSVCPPHAALDVAAEVAELGFAGIYVDANAIAPATSLEVAARLGAGTSYVDGGIIGTPPRTRGETRLFLAGDEAPTAAALFERGTFEPVVLDAPVPGASALKIAFAAWSKGSGALLLAVWAYATAAGVADGLRDEWARLHPAVLQRLAADAERTSPKAWRYVGEMHEIAASLADVGLPRGFHEAAADLYARLDGRKDAPATLEEVTGDLLGRRLEGGDG